MTHRRLVLLRGSPADTRARAREVLTELPAETVLWVGPDDASRGDVRRLLGRSFQACVVELHGGVDADVLGRCHGLVIGGGALLIRMPFDVPAQLNLVAEGWRVEDATPHFFERLERVLAAFDSGDAPVAPSTFVPTGTAEQARVVAELASAVGQGRHVVLTADRGRGKSAALGLALQDIDRAVITAAHEGAAREVFAFGPSGDRLRFASPLELAEADCQADAIIVDEAAQLPVYVLQALIERHPDLPFVFSTTTHGYEGTGRGFTLRFVEWLRRQSRPVRMLELHEPIRWSADDPLERAMFDALLLDAEPATPEIDVGPITHREVPSAELAGDEPLLRELFGLLVQAHYRTTPSDLHRLLDAPNLAVHASFADGHVVAATLVAREGGLPPDVCDALYSGARRVVGHALPETFAAHQGYADAASLSMIRSVRIAAHPALRRRGVASALVEHVHQSYEVDLFGTLFGATTDLLEFRRRVGYEVVRLSASRGQRTGVPSVAMIRPVSPRGRRLFHELRGDLARDLPAQLQLFAADEALRSDRELHAALQRDLPAAEPLEPERRAEIVHHYAHGPRTLESAVTALREFVRQTSLDGLEPALRRLVEARVVEGAAWSVAADRADLPSVPAAMRALRRAVRALVDT